MAVLAFRHVVMETTSGQGSMVGMSRGLLLLKSACSLKAASPSISAFPSELDGFIDLVCRVFGSSVLPPSSFPLTGPSSLPLTPAL